MSDMRKYRTESSYEPQRDDYLNWKDDWKKAHTVWDDGTHTTFDSVNKIKVWKNEKGQIHRDRDKPAEIGPYHIIWFRNGRKYRINDRPTTIYYTGQRLWEIDDGDLFRRDTTRPAAIYQDGFKEWYEEDGMPYDPKESIIKSTKFDPNFAKLFYDNLVHDRNYDEESLLDFTYLEYIQDLLLEKNPNLATEIPEEYLTEKNKQRYYGHINLGDIGL